MLESAAALVDEHADLEQQLADPEVFGDQTSSGRSTSGTPRSRPTVAAYHAWHAADATTSPPPASWRRRTSRSPPRCPALEATPRRGRGHLRRLLVPRDPDDDRDVILEVKAGEGGEESALFAGDLLRMYLRYAERRGWRTEVIDATESDLGGYKDVRVAVKAKGTPARARPRGRG